MSRPGQIRFLSRFAAVYDPVVHLMGFAPLWRAIADVATPAHGERVLDVCTGTGGAALELARSGAHVVGLDLAAGMLRRAHRKRGNGLPVTAHFVQMDARQLAFADRSFSLITCSMALHEMAPAERTQVLREMRRVARERVVIAEYHVPTDRRAQRMFRLTRLFEYVESDDFGSFVRADFAAWLTDAGLQAGTPRDVGGFRIWPCRVGA